MREGNNLAELTTHADHINPQPWPPARSSQLLSCSVRASSCSQLILKWELRCEHIALNPAAAIVARVDRSSGNQRLQWGPVRILRSPCWQANRCKGKC